MRLIPSPPHKPFQPATPHTNAPHSPRNPALDLLLKGRQAPHLPLLYSPPRLYLTNLRSRVPTWIPTPTALVLYWWRSPTRSSMAAMHGPSAAADKGPPPRAWQTGQLVGQHGTDPRPTSIPTKSSPPGSPPTPWGNAGGVGEQGHYRERRASPHRTAWALPSTPRSCPTLLPHPLSLSPWVVKLPAPWSSLISE